MSKTEGPPVTFPTLKIGDREYTLRYDNSTLFHLGEQGISIQRFMRDLSSGEINVATLAKFIKACIVEPCPLSAEQIWANFEIDDLAMLTGKVRDTLEKAPRRSVTLRETGANTKTGLSTN